MANTHLAASLRVVSAHVHLRFVTVEGARRRVQGAADEMASGDPAAETRRLVAKLEKATGCAIAELAGHAETWA